MIFGAARLFAQGLRLEKRAELATKATFLAQAQIETVLSQDYQNVAAGLYETRQVVEAPFERQTEVAFIDPQTLATSAQDQGLKRVSVSVFYPTNLGERTVMFSILIGKR